VVEFRGVKFPVIGMTLEYPGGGQLVVVEARKEISGPDVARRGYVRLSSKGKSVVIDSPPQ